MAGRLKMGTALILLTAGSWNVTAHADEDAAKAAAHNIATFDECWLVGGIDDIAEGDCRMPLSQLQALHDHLAGSSRGASHFGYLNDALAGVWALLRDKAPGLPEATFQVTVPPARPALPPNGTPRTTTDETENQDMTATDTATSAPPKKAAAPKAAPPKKAAAAKAAPPKKAAAAKKGRKPGTPGARGISENWKKILGALGKKADGMTVEDFKVVCEKNEAGPYWNRFIKSGVIEAPDRGHVKLTKEGAKAIAAE